jgi:hypothetical protein
MDQELKLLDLMICSGASDDTSNTVRVGGPLSAMTDEVGCDPSKSLDRVRVYVSCNRVKNLPYL